MKNRILSNYFVLFGLSILMVFASCRKDSAFSEIDIETPSVKQTIETEAFGIITDRQGQPIENATVQLGFSTTQTDENGAFRINALAEAQRAVLKVTAFGYFDAYEAFQPVLNDIHKLDIQMIARVGGNNLLANNGGVVQVDGGGTITFQPGSFQNEDGTAYDGQVLVFASYLDPTDPELDAFMPADLMAEDASGQRQLLRSFGMIKAEIYASNGEKLQLSQPAELSFPIPSELQSAAPAEIPLWFFDTEKTLWVEEGMAVKEGSAYVGEVQHFTFWNCDIPQDFVNIEGTVETNTPNLPDLRVRITVISTNDSRTNNLTNKGEFAGAVPNNELLRLEIIDQCGNVVLTEQIGPFNTDQDLGVFQVSLDPMSFVNVSGTLLDCDGEPVSSGYGVIRGDGIVSSSFLTLSDGTFEGTLLNCGLTELEFFGVDLDANLRSESTYFDASANVDLGTINVCGEPIVESLVFNYGPNVHVVDNLSLGEIVYEPNLEIFSMFAQDDTGDGTVYYQIQIVHFTDTGAFTVNAYGSSLGDPDKEFSFNYTQGNIEIINLAYSQGEIFQAILTLDSITENVSGETFQNGSIEINATIQ